MSKKLERIAEFTAGQADAGLSPNYAGYFYCFNQGLFFEAHEVLEALWLLDKKGPDGAFYKGLIQLAGAFVHVQKRRPGPAAALFRLAKANLAPYPATHWRLDARETIGLIDSSLHTIESATDPLLALAGLPAPKLELRPDPMPESSRSSAQN
jgi:predicted metal-dependent hydrolase